MGARRQFGDDCAGASDTYLDKGARTASVVESVQGFASAAGFVEIRTAVPVATRSCLGGYARRPEAATSPSLQASMIRRSLAASEEVVSRLSESPACVCVCMRVHRACPALRAPFVRMLHMWT